MCVSSADAALVFTCGLGNKTMKNDLKGDEKPCTSLLAVTLRYLQDCLATHFTISFILEIAFFAGTHTHTQTQTRTHAQTLSSL